MKNLYSKKIDFEYLLQFLLNEEASGFVNGIVIPIDGAFNAYSGV